MRAGTVMDLRIPAVTAAERSHACRAEQHARRLLTLAQQNPTIDNMEKAVDAWREFRRLFLGNSA